MRRAEQQAKAEAFLAMHHEPTVLVLPNVWDVCSARMYELEGFAAVGTTSAGIAATLGYPDGQRISLEEMVAVVQRIARRVELPVSADIEAGYANTPEGVAASARRFLHAGAVGINIEDGTGDPSAPLREVHLQREIISAVRDAARSAGVPLVVNARTDTYLVGDGAPEELFGATVARANAYREAGADSIFVPDYASLDAPLIERLVREIDAPLNVIAGARTPSVAELTRLGVARVSFGPRPMRTALALVRTMARELLEQGTYTSMLADSLTYDEVNNMFASRSWRP